jgi:hypothetical protein
MNCLTLAYKLGCGSWCTNELGDVAIEQVKGTHMVAWCWRWWCYAVVTLGCTQMTLSHMHGTVVAVLVVLLPVVPMAKALYPGAWYGATAATKPTSGLHHAQPWSASVPMCHSETQWYSSGQRDAWSRLWRARSTRVGFTGDIDYGWSSHAMYIVTLSRSTGKGNPL